MNRAGHLFFHLRNQIAPLALACLLLTTSSGPFLVDPNADGYADAIGIAIVLAGLVMRVATVGAVGIRRSGVHRRIAAPSLYQDGPYAHCRHPLYLANALILVGLSVVYDSPWMAALALPVALAAIGSMIVAEERLLAARFGEAYAGYAARVPRFAIRGLASAVVQSGWDWRRALRKEHGTIFAAGSTAILLMLAEHVGRRGFVSWHDLPQALVGSWLALATCYVGVRYLKRSGRLAEPTPTVPRGIVTRDVGADALP